MENVIIIKYKYDNDNICMKKEEEEKEERGGGGHRCRRRRVFQRAAARRARLRESAPACECVCESVCECACERECECECGCECECECGCRVTPQEKHRRANPHQPGIGCGRRGCGVGHEVLVAECSVQGFQFMGSGVSGEGVSG